MADRPSHFEIPVDDPDRAEAFYREVFGWNFQRYEGPPQYYGMATTGEAEPGINGALFARTDEASETTLTMSVDSVETALDRIKEHGGSVVQGKTAIPGMGYFATCEDTEGNRFGVFTNDSSAA